MAPGRSTTFEGEIAGLGLSDVIQLNIQNRFSGCVDVRLGDRGDQRGLLFFRDGELIHAEQGNLIGEAGFFQMMSWPGGRFALRENVATTQSTIQRSSAFLLLEALRLADEGRAGRGQAERAPAPRPHPAPTRPAPVRPFLERVRELPGVTYAVLQPRDGGRPADDSAEAETLAGQALYLAMVTRRIGANLPLGECLSAAVQGSRCQLLFLVTKNHYLALRIKAEAPPGSVEVGVRKLLAAAR
jgi:hypothetical protein